MINKIFLYLSVIWFLSNLGIHNLAVAQQKPQYTQCIMNQYIINPALSGIENYIDINASHRHQWSGIDGSPVTTYITAQGPIGKSDFRSSATSYENLNGVNPVGNEYWNDYESAPAHHGVGLQVIKDQAGPLSNLSAYGTYAYHIGLTPKLNISGGVGAGLTRYTLNQSVLDFMNTDVDPSVYNVDGINKTKFDLMAGVYLYSDKFFVGLSAQQIVPSKLVFSSNSISTLKGKAVPHTFLTAGYRFLLTEDINVIPSIMFKYIKPLPLQEELNVKLMYRDNLWCGATYRHKAGFAGMVGLRILSYINLSYAYDYNTTILGKYNSGTHELLLGITIGSVGDKNRNFTCPPKSRLW